MKPWVLVLCLTGMIVAPLRAEAPKTDASSTQAKKESYQKQVEDDLDSLSKKIDDLRRQSEKAGADTRTRVNRQIDSLDQELKTAQNKLTTVKEQTTDGWEKFRASLDKTVKHLKKSYQKTSSKFTGN